MYTQNIAGLTLLLAAFVVPALAVPPAPEIAPAMGVNAIALVAGAILIIKSRRK